MPVTPIGDLGPCTHVGSRDKQAVGEAPRMPAETPTCLSRKKQGQCKWAWRILRLEKSQMGIPMCGYEWLEKQGIIQKCWHVFSLTENHFQQTSLGQPHCVGSCWWSTLSAVTPFFYPLPEPCSGLSSPPWSQRSFHFHSELLLYLKLLFLMLGCLLRQICKLFQIQVGFFSPSREQQYTCWTLGRHYITNEIII